MANRASIDFSDSGANIVSSMAEGDETAVFILQNMFAVKAVKAIFDLDDMNMRGRQIVCAYRYSKSSMPDFLKNIARRDEGMIRHVNTVCPGPKAVVPGADSPDRGL